MTANGRPNLGGLFTGSTPPQRSSTIADALDPPRPRAKTAPSVAPPSVAPPTVTSPPAPPPAATPAAGSSAWWDPVNVLGSYFDFLQGVFDANRAVVMAVATAVTAPLRGSRSTR